MTTKISRRDFLKMTGIAGGGVVLAVYLEGCAPNKGTPTVVPVQVTPESSPTPRPPFDWNADIYIKLDQDGVTLSGINGNIELQLGSDVNADFDAHGMNGRIVSDLPNVSIDKSRHGNYSARIGSGGVGISAKGINGNIRFTRSAIDG